MVAAELPLPHHVHGVEGGNDLDGRAELDGALEEAARRVLLTPGREQDVHGLAELVDRSAEVLPLPPSRT